MSQTSRQTRKTASTGDFLDLLSDGAASLLAKVQERRRLARDHKLLEQLSAAQLEDVGIDGSAIRPPRPAVEVKAGLMTNLMSMR